MVLVNTIIASNSMDTKARKKNELKPKLLNYW